MELDRNFSMFCFKKVSLYHVVNKLLDKKTPGLQVKCDIITGIAMCANPCTCKMRDVV